MGLELLLIVRNFWNFFRDGRGTVTGIVVKELKNNKAK